ncbi:MAG: helix-turn-helix domain-containing protein [Treponema sp.]|jgi:transcriptional regulator with XRE-family HTH domain|nr:helix-turn-helix domain-containing protein [Treponema sp.]
MTEDELRAVVRTNIRRYRSFRQWTQAELAEKLEISVNFLCDIENGKRWISPASMVKIANTLNIEPFELFKPACAPLPAVSALFAKYNDEVAEAVSTSLKQVYGYFQVHLTEELTAAGEGEGI